LDFHDNEHTISVLHRAVRIQPPRGLSQAELLRQLTAFGDVRGKALVGAPLRFSRHQLGRFANFKTVPRPRLGFLKLLWEFFLENGRADLLEQALAEERASKPSYGAYAEMTHAFLSGDALFDVRRLAKLEGDYVAFRRFFGDYDKIMVMHLECGVKGSLSTFRVRYRWPNDEGRWAEDEVEGWITPYHDSVLFQGRMVKAASPYIFILSGGFPTDPATGMISEATGALLAGAAGTVPSAYPIHIKRTDEPPELTILSANDLGRILSRPEEVLRTMARGVVGWR
jgi:hypothetical protein